MGGRTGRHAKRPVDRKDVQDLWRHAGRGTENLPPLVPSGTARVAALRFLGLTPSASDPQAHEAIKALMDVNAPKFERYYRTYVEPYEPPPIREVRFVDVETYARIVRSQNDPLYGRVPYEAVYEGGDPEDGVLEAWSSAAMDPDFDEVITEVENRDFGRYRVPVATKKSSKLSTKTVTIKRPHRVVVPIKQSPALPQPRPAPQRTPRRSARLRRDSRRARPCGESRQACEATAAGARPLLRV